jgi:hypothetical protein
MFTTLCGDRLEYLNRKRLRIRNTVVLDQKVMCGYGSSTTLTSHQIHCKLQTCPLVRDDAHKNNNIVNVFKRKDKDEIWSWTPKKCPIPRSTGRLTVGHKSNHHRNLQLQLSLQPPPQCSPKRPHPTPTRATWPQATATIPAQRSAYQILVYL